MILGATMSRKAGIPDEQAVGFIVFPLAIHAMDCVVSAIGIMSVGMGNNNAKPTDPYEVHVVRMMKEREGEGGRVRES
jgi:inorganic pyrophosphatase